MEKMRFFVYLLWGAGRPRRKEGEWGEGPSLAITTMVGLEFA